MFGALYKSSKVATPPWALMEWDIYDVIIFYITFPTHIDIAGHKCQSVWKLCKKNYFRLIFIFPINGKPKAFVRISLFLRRQYTCSHLYQWIPMCFFLPFAARRRLCSSRGTVTHLVHGSPRSLAERGRKKINMKGTVLTHICQPKWSTKT